jgi:hypothetical protein
MALPSRVGVCRTADITSGVSTQATDSIAKIPIHQAILVKVLGLLGPVRHREQYRAAGDPRDAVGREAAATSRRV